jgi:5'-3' exonuclease
MTIAIIDGNFLLHRCMKVGTMSTLKNRHGKYTGGVFGSLRSIFHLLLTYKDINQCYVVYDSGISIRRRSIFPPYKGYRYRDKNDPFYEEIEEDKVKFIKQFSLQRNILKKIFNSLNIRFIRLVKEIDNKQIGFEADDLIGVLSNLVKGRVYIVSDDKDMLQLCSKRVFNIRPIAKQVINLDNFDEVVGYTQDEYMLYKCILGDSGSDKISGIKSVGDKTIEKAIRGYNGKIKYPYDKFFEYCLLQNNRRINAITENLSIVLRNYELINISLEVIDSFVLERLHKYINSSIIKDRNECRRSLMRICTELDFLSIVKDFNSWVVPFQRLV